MGKTAFYGKKNGEESGWAKVIVSDIYDVFTSLIRGLSGLQTGLWLGGSQEGSIRPGYDRRRNLEGTLRRQREV